MKMRLSVFIYAFALLGLSLTSYIPIQEKVEIAAKKIAYAGHGMFVHKEMKEVQLDTLLLTKMRDSVLYEPVNAQNDTDYMARCRARGVPIPPDWAPSGTPWEKQGTLSQNILAPGKYAEVWTFSNPSVRGACIALPRTTGNSASAPPGAAGFICQSATGNACFWDNRDSQGKLIDWSSGLVISKLRDGSNLTENCTACHRGNNVFLMSPDDPTWAKLLRGPLSDPSTGNFTTQVESSSDNQGGYPRYIPITTFPKRPGWENPFSPGNCSGACHEQPPPNLTPRGPMPPICANSSLTDPSACYGPAHIPSVQAFSSPLANASGWTNADAHVTLREFPPPVSVQSLTYETQGAKQIPRTTVQSSSASFTISEPGQTTVRYFATRNQGRPPGLWGTLIIKVDKTPPAITPTVTTGNAPNEHIVTLKAVDEPGGSGIKLIEYQAYPTASVVTKERIDDATLSLTVTATGPTYIFYWATDIADNFGGPPNLTFKPVVELDPTSLVFNSPPNVVSPPQSVRLKNIGDATLLIVQIAPDSYAFGVQSNPNKPCGASLLPGAECYIDVVFVPFIADTYDGLLYIHTNTAPSPITVPLTGKGTLPAVEFTPLLLSFPDTELRDTSPPQKATIRNSGEAPLLIKDANPLGSDFAIHQDGCTPKPKTLQPGETCDIEVTFSPRRGGPIRGGLVLSDNTLGSQDTLPLKGVGLTVPAASFGPTSLNFGSQPISTSGAPQTLVLTSSGTAVLDITALSLGGGRTLPTFPSAEVRAFRAPARPSLSFRRNRRARWQCSLLRRLLAIGPRTSYSRPTCQTRHSKWCHSSALGPLRP